MTTKTDKRNIAKPLVCVPARQLNMGDGQNDGHFHYTSYL